MNKPVIRSITVFTHHVREWSVEEVREKIIEAYNLLSETHRILTKNGYSVWTTRLTLPKPPVEAYDRLQRILTETVPDKHLMVNTGGLYIEKLDVKLLEELVSHGVYTGLLWRDKPPVNETTEIFYHISSIDPEYATRIAVSLNGKPLETPYYPLSTSIKGLGVGIALLYPKVLVEAHRDRGLEGIREVIVETHREITSLLSPKTRLVIDHSISPWMDNSVASLIEVISGEDPGSPGFIEGVKTLNRILEETLNDEYIGGFNEVMLPYAEDQRLMDAGRRRTIRARDLLYYSMICVAGPDMIVVPLDRDRLYSFVKASFILGGEIGRIKALRIIPVDAEVGEEVEIGKFGWIPVLDY